MRAISVNITHFFCHRHKKFPFPLTVTEPCLITMLSKDFLSGTNAPWSTEITVDGTDSSMTNSAVFRFLTRDIDGVGDVGRETRTGRTGADLCSGGGQIISWTTALIPGLVSSFSAQYVETFCHSISDITGEPEGRFGRSPLMTFISTAGSVMLPNG